MTETAQRLKYWFGQFATLFVLGFTLMFIPTGFDLWQSEPAFVDYDPSSTMYDVSFVTAILIGLIVGLYVTRNIYRWSKTQRA
ncbi:hypothetical protein Halru_1840 [Halovivax ruber XH-70]|uniref:Uncharacterized protein n=1 Tax=Halovivax ruber (strain DSM 18193 / JCM 13892 / XH-70) TaxID=797302 RepID=L0ICF9_HALRX|nr:hypothetical protein [Halovivax ruber]AGB16439.1 hypothetical protein Halru_1840 [Halovivax ruber XH-70]